MHVSFKEMMEQMFHAMDKPLQNNPYQQATEAWNKQMQQMVHQWQKMFKV